MNKISLYILLILIFLGLSKSFSLAEKDTIYIKNKEMMGRFFEGLPLSVLLIDSFQTGFLIKTYYHKYKVVYGYKQPRILTVRTSENFNLGHLPNIGMELFRRGEGTNSESTVPMPPGILFIGNPGYGNWTILDSGERVWTFYRTYRHFNRVLGWGDFRPSYEFYQKAMLHLEQSRPFYGINNEFGTNGTITKKNFPEYYRKKGQKKLELKDFLKNLTRPNIIWNHS